MKNDSKVFGLRNGKTPVAINSDKEEWARGRWKGLGRNGSGLWFSTQKLEISPRHSSAESYWWMDTRILCSKEWSGWRCKFESHQKSSFFSAAKSKGLKSSKVLD